METTNNRNPNKIKWLLIGLVILVIVIGAIFLLREVVQDEKGNYVVEVIVERGDTTYEVRNYTEQGRTLLYKNGKEEKVLTKYPRKPTVIMELPKVEGTYDVESKGKEVATYTYESELKDSSKYVNFLISKGYKVEQKASTSEYIEIYMTKEEETRRIIIFNSKLMVGELKAEKIPSYEQHIQLSEK